MLKHEPLFKINGRYLYREHNLITIQVPVFFICKDNKRQHYLVLLDDFDEDTYVVCPVSDKDLYNMLQGNIVMRQPFFYADKIYFVQAGIDFSKDKIKLVSYDEIEDILPEKDAKFEIVNDALLYFYTKNLYYNLTRFDANTNRRSTLNIRKAKRINPNRHLHPLRNKK